MSDPARDGYQCHGPMTAIISQSKGPIGFICETCGVTRHGLRPTDPDRDRADRVLNRLALTVPKSGNGVRRFVDIWVSW